jgi:BirA family biotin operon repressor/biotin-[acetyl-CoA-carboxylase] ligase
VIGRIAAARRLLPTPVSAAPLPWRLDWRPVCASTETCLDRWLATGASPPLAVVSRRQRHGHGQWGRVWSSPPGGVWLSAALPWPWPPGESAAPGLSVAVGLALQLEALGLPVAIKWPNDLLVGGRKIAGLLPRWRLGAGRVRLARVGVGLNGRNRVPAGAISLREALGRRSPPSEPAALAARVLVALEWAVAHGGEAEPVRRAAEQRLWRPHEPVAVEGELWRVEGLNTDGSLAIARGERRRALRRTF